MILILWLNGEIKAYFSDILEKKWGRNFLSKVWIVTILSFASILVSARDHLGLHSEVCLIIAIKSWNKLCAIKK